MILEKFILIADGEIIKSYRNFKQAIKDLGFYSIIYNEVHIYQEIVTNEQ